jgi:hypothetical protein
MLQQPDIPEKEQHLMAERRVLLSQPYNFEEGVETGATKDTRRFLVEPVGYGYAQVHKEMDYTSEEEIDNGWMQISFDNPDFYGGEDGRMCELLELLNNDGELAKIINKSVERGE